MSLFRSMIGGSDHEPVLKAKNKIDGVDKNSDITLEKLSKDIESGDVHTYLFLYWKDCGHCKMAYNDWKKFEEVIANNSTGKHSAYAIEQLGASELSDELLNDIGGPATGFPTFRYVYGRKSQDYNGERDIESLKGWMKETSGTTQSGGKRCRHHNIKNSCKHCKRLKRSRKNTKKNKKKRKGTTKKRRRKTHKKYGGMDTNESDTRPAVAVRDYQVRTPFQQRFKRKTKRAKLRTPFSIRENQIEEFGESGLATLNTDHLKSRLSYNKNTRSPGRIKVSGVGCTVMGGKKTRKRRSLN